MKKIFLFIIIILALLWHGGWMSSSPVFAESCVMSNAGSAFISNASRADSCGDPLQIAHTVGDVAPVSKIVIYGTVASSLTGSSKCWITQNLGADSQAPSVTDTNEDHSGWYWQFNKKQGFKHDGTTRTPSTTWTTQISEDSNWTSGNDPCTSLLGTGWRLPTSIEWQNAISNGGWTTWTQAYASPLKLHAAGFLYDSSGALDYKGVYGNYRSSTQDTTITNGLNLNFNDSVAVMYNHSKAFGFSARCVRDIVPYAGCKFSNNVDGLDTGTGIQNTAKLTVPRNKTLTIIDEGSNPSTLAVGSMIIEDGSSVVIPEGSQIMIGAAIYMKDADGDGYPAAGEQKASFTDPGAGWKRKNTFFEQADRETPTSSTGLIAQWNFNDLVELPTTDCNNTFSVAHTAGTVAPVTKTVVYNSVASNLSGSNKCWIAQNLGATNMASAFSDSTEASAGWYWQFGLQQGYKYEGTTRTPNSTWITSVSDNNHWNSTKDPCTLLLGAAWRLPSNVEMNALFANGGWINSGLAAYNSNLKMHANGGLNNITGAVVDRGGTGVWYSSTSYNATTTYYWYTQSTFFSVARAEKAYGWGVRCLRDVIPSVTVSAGSCGAACSGKLNGFANLTSADALAGSGLTAANKKWGAGAFMFDGTNDYMSVADSDTLSPTLKSVESWVKMNALGTNKMVVWKENEYGIIYNATAKNCTANKFGFAQYNGSAWVCASSTTTPVTGQWYHLVGTYDGTNVRLYVNGVLEGGPTVAGSSPNTTNNLIIGGLNGTGTNEINGTIDSTRIYSRALTATEILSNYTREKLATVDCDDNDATIPVLNPCQGGVNLATGDFERGKTVGGAAQSYYGEIGKDPSLVGLWHLNETADNTCTGGVNDACDSSGNINNGAATGTTIVDGIMGKGRQFNLLAATQTDSINTSITNTSSAKFSNAFTASAWIYPTAWDASHNTIMGQENGFLFAINASGVPANYIYAAAALGGPDVGCPTVSLNKWSHMALVYDDNMIMSYLNGVRCGSGIAKTGVMLSTSLVYIGMRNAAGTKQPFHGSIDEAALYSRALTPEEIHAQATRSPWARYTSPVIDMETAKTSIPFTWTGEGIGTRTWSSGLLNTTTEGEAPYSTTGLVAEWKFNESSLATAYNGEIPGTTPTPMATGGTITESGGYRIHTFTADATFTPAFTGNVEYLVVGGGGGGGANSSTCGGGGGGGGGVRSGSINVISSGYAVVVGTGGAGGGGNGGDGVVGINSSFNGVIADGGGGGPGGAKAGKAGGSGSGGGSACGSASLPGGTGIVGQGYAGGIGATVYGGGGGGGANAVGGNSNGSIAGVGGSGKTSSITGSSVLYGGGGGGGGSASGSSGGGGGAGGGGAGSGTAAGTGGTNGLGGGGGYASSVYYSGGKGGDGIVIVRYPFPTPTPDPGGTCGAACNGTLTNFTNLTAQDALAGSGWTAANKKWGAGALMFDGTNDFVEVGTGPSVKGLSQYTLETWFKVNSMPAVGAAQTIYKEHRNSDTSVRTKILIENVHSTYGNEANSLTFRFRDTDALATPLNVTTGPNSIAAGQWYHVVAVYDAINDIQKVYLNGALVKTGTNVIAAVSNTPPFSANRIGVDATTEYFNGTIDSTRVYNRALTAAEILSNYNSGNIEFQWRAGSTATPDSTDYAAGTNWTKWSASTNVPKSCYELLELGVTTSGYYTIDPDGSGGNDPFSAYCDMTTDGGGWTRVAKFGTAYNIAGSTYTTGFGVATDTQYAHPCALFNSFRSTHTMRINMGSVKDYFKPTSSYTLCQMISESPSTHFQWSSSYNGTFLTPSYYTAHLGGSVGSWSAAIDGRAYLSFWGGGGAGSGCCHNTSTIYGGSVDGAVWGRAFEMYVRETEQIDSMDSSQASWYWDINAAGNADGATALYTPKTKAQDATIKTEGSGSMKVGLGQPRANANTVGLWHLDEVGGAGAYLEDSSGNANHGTPVGTTVVNGVFGSKGRNFPGIIDNYLSLGDLNNAIDGVNKFTYEAWINRKGTSGGAAYYDGIITKTYADTNRSILVLSSAVAGADDLYAGIGSGAVSAYGTTSSNLIQVNVWRHVAMVFDGTQSTNATRLKVYIDGVQQALTFVNTVPALTGVNDSPVLVGKLSGYTFNGIIDEVHISNSARTAEEINENYRAGRDHGVTRVISSTDLTNKSKLSFWFAGDRLGTYSKMIVGSSAFANYEPDANTVGLWHLEEQNGTGAYIKDSAGSYHGTPAMTYTNGKIGKGRLGTAATEISLGSQSIADGLANVMVSAWVYPTAQTAGTHFRVFSEQYVLYVGQYGAQVSFYMGNGTAFTSTDVTGGAIPINQWSHITWVKSGVNYFIYINGALTKSGTTAPATLGTSANINYIGSYDGATQGWVGHLDEVRVDNVARTPAQIREAYEVERRSHPITVDFKSGLVAGALIADVSDLAFSVDETVYGSTVKANHLFVGDKIIVKEKVGMTEYIAQGTVASVVSATGAVTVSAWDSGSTFPPTVGFSVNATVFKWQKELMDLTGTLPSQRSALTYLTFRPYDMSSGATMWIDDIRAVGPYINTSGKTLTLPAAKRYWQLRALFSTSDTAVSPSLTSLNIQDVPPMLTPTPTPSCQIGCMKCSGGSAVPVTAGADDNDFCAPIVCSGKTWGWGASAPLSCMEAAVKTANNGMCNGAGACYTALSDVCQEKPTPALASCGSAGCKKACGITDTFTSSETYNTPAEICYTDYAQHACPNSNEKCNEAGTCVTCNGSGIACTADDQCCGGLVCGTDGDSDGYFSLTLGHTGTCQTAKPYTDCNDANVTYHQKDQSTGGTITTSGGYRIHTFTTVGNATFTSACSGDVEYLVVAGGGGGGGGIYHAGGGGGGGVLSGSNYSVSSGTPIPVTVGGGGPGGGGSAQGSNGVNSVFGTITATGGGGGACSSSGGGKNGGSGGGATYYGSYNVPGTGISGQGYRGGYAIMYGSGGGGGAGAVGFSAPSMFVAGNGGSGISNSISGASVYYGGGGGGAICTNSGVAQTRGWGGLGGGGYGSDGIIAPANGTANTGGGGGGAERQSTTGGTGGSGIVIVRYIP